MCVYIYIYISGLNENNSCAGSNVISTVKLKQTGVAAVIGRTGHTVSTLLIVSSESVCSLLKKIYTALMTK